MYNNNQNKNINCNKITLSNFEDLDFLTKLEC